MHCINRAFDDNYIKWIKGSGTKRLVTNTKKKLTATNKKIFMSPSKIFPFF
jgi:hypothetical protein